MRRGERSELSARRPPVHRLGGRDAINAGAVGVVGLEQLLLAPAGMAARRLVAAGAAKVLLHKGLESRLVGGRTHQPVHPVSDAARRRHNLLESEHHSACGGAWQASRGSTAALHVAVPRVAGVGRQRIGPPARPLSPPAAERQGGLHSLQRAHRADVLQDWRAKVLKLSLKAGRL